MLDRKTKDWDASVELLEDKQKQAKVCWLLFYCIGLFSTFGSSFFSTWIAIEILAIGIGLAFLILATWCLMIYLQYDSYLFFIHKDLVKAEVEK